jgi:HSP20 family protein
LTRTYLEELAELRRRFNGLLEQALLRGAYGGEGKSLPGTWTPAVDVLETETCFLLFVELPGVDREDIELGVEPRRLVLSGRRQPLGEEHRFLRLEGSHGPFQREFELTQEVEPEAATAALDDGLLRITLPKRGKRRSRRSASPSSIPISDAASEEGEP